MKVPGVEKAVKIPGTDAAKNLYNAFNLGFNPRAYFGRSPGKVFASSLHVFSPSGLMTTGGLMGAGAAIGAVTGSMMEGDMTVPGAAVGAAAGVAALPALGAAARVGVWGAPKVLSGVGSAVLKAPQIGFAAAKGGLNLAAHARSPVIPNIGKSSAGFASMMVDWDSTKAGKELLESVKLTGPITGAIAGGKSIATYKETVAGFKSASLMGKAKIGAKTVGLTAGKGIQGVTGAIINGKTVLWGSSAIAGAAGAFNEMNRAHMGQMDGQITRPAARVPSYDLTAGATGDLVFALNANRRG